LDFAVRGAGAVVVVFVVLGGVMTGLYGAVADVGIV
jgi:hypothetical protein